MWKLIKMDFYRLFTSRMVTIATVMAALVAAVYMLLSLAFVEVGAYAAQTDPESLAGVDILIPQLGWIGGVDFADIVIEGTSAFSLFIGCMITANFIGTEQSSGYTKNFAGQIPNKGYMAISKFVVTSLSQIMILLVYTGVASGLGALMMGKYITGYDITTLIAAIGLKILLFIAINSIIIFICTLTKSHAVAMVFGCIFGIGITRFLYFIITSLLTWINITFPIGDFMPDGINSQLNAGAVSELALKGVLVSIAFTVVFTTANYLLIRKRDVR